MRRSIIDPRMFKSLQDFYPSRVRIETSIGIQNEYGEVINSIWYNTHIDLSANIAPGNTFRSMESEIRRPDGTVITDYYVINFSQRIDGLTETMRIVEGNDIYHIVGIDVDSHKNQTRAYAELVTPTAQNEVQEEGSS